MSKSEPKSNADHSSQRDDDALYVKQVKEKSTMLLDALPYIDDFPEDYESYALSLIDEEMKSMEPTQHLSPSPIASEPRLLKPLSRLEYQRLVARDGQPRPASESFRSRGSGPLQPPAQPLIHDEHAWKMCLRSAKIEFESQRSRQLNLELQQYYEPDQWRLYALQLSKQEERMNKRSEQQQLSVDTLNIQRKDMQEKGANKLKRLSQQFNELIQRNHRLQSATLDLEQEVKRCKVENNLEAE